MTTQPRTEAGAQRAVAEWLLGAATRPPAHGSHAWQDHGILLLTCGVLFSAVRLPADLVQSAAGSTDEAVIDLYLAGALLDGPVICDRHAGWYYALVAAGTANRWSLPGVMCLGRNSTLGTPHPSANGSAGERLYWSVPMDSPGTLCTPHAVARLVETTRDQAATHA